MLAQAAGAASSWSKMPLSKPIRRQRVWRERERERRRREETVGNCGDNGKKYEETKQTEEEGA